MLMLAVILSVLLISNVYAQLSIYIPVARPVLKSVTPDTFTFNNAGNQSMTLTIFNNVTGTGNAWYGNIYVELFCGNTDISTNSYGQHAEYQIPGNEISTVTFNFNYDPLQPTSSQQFFNCIAKAVNAGGYGNYNSSLPFTLTIAQVIPPLSLSSISVTNLSSDTASTTFAPGQYVGLNFGISGGVPPYYTQSILHCNGGNPNDSNIAIDTNLPTNTSRFNLPSNVTAGACFISATAYDSKGTSSSSESGQFHISSPSASFNAPMPYQPNGTAQLVVTIISIIIVAVYLLKTQQGKAKGALFYIGALLLIIGINWFISGILFPSSASCSNNGYGWACSPPTISVVGLIIAIIVAIVGYYLIMRNSKVFNQKINNTVSHDNTHKFNTQKSDEDDALKTLKMRYAKGDITKKQFDRMKKDLE